MAADAIEVEGLGKRYGETVGLADLSLAVPTGEVFGFIGPNGAGKTTAIRLLLDLIRPTSGNARVLGLDCRRDSLEVRRRCGYLPGELKLPARPTGRRFLAHIDRLRDRTGGDRIAPLADRLGLDLDRPIGALSKGNRQKVGLVAALMCDPELLILDEPTSGLDPLRQDDVQALIRERARAGRTVFLSSHSLDAVARAADRVGIVRDGRLIGTESPADLRARAPRRTRVGLSGPEQAGELAEQIASLSGVEGLERDGVHLAFDLSGPADPLIKVLARFDIETFTSEEPDLSRIFLRYYEPGEGEGA